MYRVQRSMVPLRIAADIPPKAFEAIIRIVNMVHTLGLTTDKHNRNLILSSYIQYVFTTPLGQHPAHAFNRSATMQGTHACTCTCTYTYMYMYMYIVYTV